VQPERKGGHCTLAFVEQGLKLIPSLYRMSSCDLSEHGYLCSLGSVDGCFIQYDTAGPEISLQFFFKPAMGEFSRLADEIASLKGLLFVFSGIIPDYYV
jgi:hypothetical protein